MKIYEIIERRNEMKETKERMIELDTDVEVVRDIEHIRQLAVIQLHYTLKSFFQEMDMIKARKIIENSDV